jgi:hypothetical protein
MLAISAVVATSAGGASALVFGTSSVSGVVTGPTGAPVSFVFVEAFQFDGTSWNVGQSAITAADGSYTITGLPDGMPLELEFLPFGDQTLTIQWFDHAASQVAATSFTLAAGEARTINAQLDKAATVSGHVTLADGTPLNGSVTLYDPVTGITWGGGLFGGTFSATASPGNYVVYAQTDPFPVSDIAPAYYGQSFSIDTATRVTVTAGAQVTGIDVTLAPGAVITGRLLDANAQPIVGGGIVELTNNGPPGFSFGPSAGTDANGVFTLVGIPTGTYKYQVTGPEASLFVGTTVDVTTTVPNTTNVDVQLDRGYFAHMTLHNAAGVLPSSSPGGSIIVCRGTVASTTALCGPAAVPVAAQPSPSGDTWLVGPLTPGDYVAFPDDARIGGLGLGTPVPFTVLPGQTVACDLSLPDLATPSTCVPAPLLPTGTISGRVVGPDGVGIPGVAVFAQYSIWTVFSSVLTDANGDYTMPGTIPGDFRVLFNPPLDRPDLGRGYWSAGGTVFSQQKAGTVTVADGVVTGGIDGQLSKMASGTISVTTNGVPNGFSPSQVAFCPSPGTFAGGVCSDGSTPIGGNSSAFGQPPIPLPAGTWTARLQTFSFPSLTLGSVATFTVKGGDTFSCSLDTLPTGPSSCTVAGAPPADTTPPVITPSVSPPVPDGNNGWYRSDVSVHFGVDEPESPATLTTSGCGDVSVTADQPATTYSCTASSAGGAAGPVDVTVRRDATAPGVAWSGGIADGQSFVFGSVPGAPTCAATDALSGPDTCTVQGYSTAVGTHVLTATSTDLAGNVGAAAITYTVTPYSLVGFRASVRPVPFVNFRESGDDVRFQWEVFAGATELTTTGVISSFTATPASCVGFIPSGAAVDLTVGNPITRDLRRGVFSLKWQPTRRQRGCWVITMTTDDGSSLSARVRVK